MLASRNGRLDSLTVRARVVDPGEGLDMPASVTIEEGIVTAVEAVASAPAGLVLAPAFVDPHVHLRTPGREDEETIASGTQAAAAGGYCAIVAMPNTDPVVDTAPVLRALVEQALEEAVVPTGFTAAISKGQRGEELTEMAELAAAGAIAFTDDGRPVASAGLMRRALAYSAVADRPLALHCEEPTLSRDGQMHEGAVSAELGLAGWPSVAESLMVERDLSLAGYERRPIHLQHLSARASVDAVRRARALGVRVSAEATPHHLCATDELVRTLDANAKMNPPLGSEDDRRALVEGLLDGTVDCIATDHAPHARHEKDVPFEQAPFGVTGLETAFAALNTFLVREEEVPLAVVLDRLSAGPARALGLPVPRIAIGEPANLVLVDLEAEWTVSEDGFRSRSANSWLLGADARRLGREDRRRGPGGVLGVRGGGQGYLLLEDGTTFRGRSVAAEGSAFGEAVFTTGMTGYQETVTDPSYAEQLVCFTAPMVGNYGVDERRLESGSPHARAVLMRRLGGEDWALWLAERGIVALDEIDTRSLTLRVRDGGAMRAVAVADERTLPVADALEQVRAQPSMEGQALVAGVSTAEPYTFGDHDDARVSVAVVDYGVKKSILRRLVKAGAAATVFPHLCDPDELASFDGVLLSNGPGDPAPLVEETEVVRAALGRVAVLGICLGHQLIGLATDHETTKLPFGHRGANHPVLDRRTGRVLVTSQNHGFAVVPSERAEATHVSLYDGTVEGFDFPELRAQSVQFHPEAGPGPHDAWPILERWVESLGDGR